MGKLCEKVWEKFEKSLGKVGKSMANVWGMFMEKFGGKFVGKFGETVGKPFGGSFRKFLGKVLGRFRKKLGYTFQPCIYFPAHVQI